MTDEVEQMQACLDAAYVKFNVRPLWWAKEALFEAMRTYAAQVRASTLEEVVPHGWRLVPIEPTAEMQKAGFPTMNDTAERGAHPYTTYQAMLAASPPPPITPPKQFCYECGSELSVVCLACNSSLSPPPQTEASMVEEVGVRWRCFSCNTVFTDRAAAFAHIRLYREDDSKIIREVHGSGAVQVEIAEASPSPPPEADGWIPCDACDGTGQCAPAMTLETRGPEEDARRAHENSFRRVRCWKCQGTGRSVRPAPSPAAPLDEADWRKAPITAGMLYEMIFDGTFLSEGNPPVLTPSMFAAAIHRIAIAALERGRAR